MQFLQIVSLVLSLVVVSSAMPRDLEANVRSDLVQRITTIGGVNIQAFLISDMDLITAVLPDKLTCNHTLSFVFTDPNSNGTSTNCSSSWITQNNGTNTAPLSYVVCEPNGNDEFFQWQFNTYTNLTSFNLRFTHEFSDPVDYPPPYNFVQYFSDAQINLVCGDAAGLSCSLPVSPLHAVVNRVSD